MILHIVIIAIISYLMNVKSESGNNGRQKVTGKVT